MMIKILWLICVWLFLGWVGSDIFTRGEDLNPLWKIPLTLIGPINLLVLLGVGLFYIFRSYVDDVKRYYKRKSENERKNNRRTSGNDAKRD